MVTYLVLVKDFYVLIWTKVDGWMDTHGYFAMVTMAMSIFTFAII